MIVATRLGKSMPHASRPWWPHGARRFIELGKDSCRCRQHASRGASQNRVLCLHIHTGKCGNSASVAMEQSNG